MFSGIAGGKIRVKTENFLEFMRKMYLFSNKTKKNRKKPVETEESELTKRSERLKVNCGTVLRTRMNTDDFALQKLERHVTKTLCGRDDLTLDIYRNVRRSNTHGKGNDQDSAGSPHGGEARAHQQADRSFLELLAETAVKETKKNGEFTIPGIGKLVKAERKARLGRNPQTGETIKIKAKTVVKFRVAKVAKDTIAPPKK